MCFCIRKSERTAPRTSKHDPLFHPKKLPQLLDILDKMPGGVFVERRSGHTFAATSLIEQKDPVFFRVEKLPVSRFRPSPRATMQKHDRLSLRVATFFPIQLVFLADSEKAAACRF